MQEVSAVPAEIMGPNALRKEEQQLWTSRYFCLLFQHAEAYLKTM